MRIKKLKYLSILFLLIFVIICNLSFSQTTIQAKLAGIGIHPFDSKNSHLYHNTIDANGIFNVEPMLMIPIETFIRGDYLSWRFVPAFLSDAVGYPAFFLHLGLKQRIVQIWRNSFSIAAGGNLYGREIWRTIPGYHLDNSWSQNGTWEYKIGILAEIEYAFFLNEKNDLTLSVIYGHQPETFTFTIGYRYWFSNIIKNPPKCGTCPFQHTQGRWKP